LCITNCHLIVLDGHNSHITIVVVHKTKGKGLDLNITFPSHIRYVFTKEKVPEKKT
jgi:hypothetical protein